MPKHLSCYIAVYNISRPTAFHVHIVVSYNGRTQHLGLCFVVIGLNVVTLVAFFFASDSTMLYLEEFWQCISQALTASAGDT